MIKILIACIMILGISNAVSASEKDFNISCKPFDFKDSFYIKENSKSNLYYNPINKGSCFFLLFEENDFFNLNNINEYYHNDLIIPFSIFNKIKSTSVRKIYIDTEDKVFDFMRFSRSGSEYANALMHMNNFEIYKEYGDTILFYHEIFHLGSKKDSSTTEMYADIFGLLNVIKFYNISHEDFVELVRIANILRFTSYGQDKDSVNPLENFYNTVQNRIKFNKVKLEVNNCNNFNCLYTYSSIF